MPSPAGVSAPLSASPTVPLSASILRANSWHPSRSRPALYDRNAASSRSAADTPAVTAGGSILCRPILCRYALFSAVPACRSWCCLCGCIGLGGGGGGRRGPARYPIPVGYTTPVRVRPMSPLAEACRLYQRLFTRSHAEAVRLSELPDTADRGD